MTTEENKALVRRWYAELVQGNLAAIDEFLAPDLVDHTLPPGMPPGREGARQILTMFLTAFKEFQVTLEDQIAEGDKVVIRYTGRAVHAGEFMGIPPTGKKVTLNGIDIVRIVNGKIAEHWESFDQLSLLQQIGALPAPA